VDIWPGTSIQGVVNNFGGNTTFCLRAGTHSLRSAITPKTGNIFVGQYGAILDGTGWTTTDPNTGAFRAHNEDIDDVTIRNLVIRNMPQRAIHAYKDHSDRWTVEFNELASSRVGISAPDNSLVRNNYIHHNVEGGYQAYQSANTVFEGNEIAYNSGKQKVLGATNITFRNNFVHHIADDGIWYDTSVGGIVEGNVVEDSGREGISAEASRSIVIRNNTVRRSATSGIFISMSQGIEAYNNTVVGNFRAIQYFVNCTALPAGLDLANNVVRDNVVTVGTEPGAQANTLTYTSSCTATQIAPYLNGSKNLQFLRNNYSVSSLTTDYFVWGFGSAGLKSWSEWQALGNDTTGVLQLR
jgi:parallel beta-helix repeat protein